MNHLTGQRHITRSAIESAIELFARRVPTLDAEWLDLLVTDVGVVIDTRGRPLCPGGAANVMGDGSLPAGAEDSCATVWFEEDPTGRLREPRCVYGYGSVAIGDDDWEDVEWTALVSTEEIWS